MTEQLITEIQRKMLPYLNNEQLMHLRDAMAETLEGATITYDSGSIPADEADAVEAFITAKRIEGCSEKTLSYYRKTIEALIAGVGKAVRQITSNRQISRRIKKHLWLSNRSWARDVHSFGILHSWGALAGKSCSAQASSIWLIAGAFRRTQSK